MDPSEKNWLSRYLQLRVDFPLPKFEGEVWTSSKKLYSYLQPTGIIYGHPIELPKEIEIEYSQWPVKERLEVIVLESLISAWLIENKADNVDANNLDKAVNDIIAFYETSFPEFLKKGLFESKVKNSAQQLERILPKRITVKPEWNAEFWRGFFHNILLFLDVIVFVEYIKAHKKEENFNVKDRILELQKNIIQLLSVIVNLDKTENKKNDNFLRFFIDSTILDKNEKEKALGRITNPNIESVLEFLSNSPWIIKKYFLELAILSIWADNHVKLAEKDFIDKLSKNLELNNLDIEESIYAVETFVLLHWQQVHYLQSKQNYLILSKRITQRMLAISKKYGSQIKNEIEENKELIELLKTSQKRPLSIEEKEKVRSQLIDVLKTIPAFVVLAMPMAFLTVPILMKILPRNLFPSSFDPNRLMAPRGKNFIEE
jgi:hypothetical protein